MGTLLIIVGVFAAIGAILALLGGGEKDEAAAGALLGAAGSMGCMLQLMIMALPVLIGL